jgi:hypothetical protein
MKFPDLTARERQDLRSALNVAENLLLGLLTASAMFVGAAIFLGRFANDAFPRWVGVASVCFSLAVLFFTVTRWAKWVCIASAFASFKFIFALVMGESFTVPKIVVPRMWSVGFLCLFLIVSLLTKAYLHRKPNQAEKVLLVLLVFGLVWMLLDQSPVPLFLAVIGIGFVQLLVGMNSLGDLEGH